MKRFKLLPFLLPSLLLSAPAFLRAQDATWFRDITPEVGLNDIPVWRIYAADVNNDAYPDLLLENGLYQRNQLKLYLNLPDPNGSGPGQRKFVDVTELSGINANPEPGIDTRVADIAALADIDNDGDVDLVTGRFYYAYADLTMLEDRAEVLLNDGTGRFTLREYNGLHDMNGMNVTGLGFLDYDLDGLLDLYVGTFSFNHQQSQYMKDYLFKGKGDGTFEDMTDPSGIGAVKQPLYGVNISDWNNDGWPDVITSPYCRTSGSLWMNRGDGTFADVAAAVGYSSQVKGGDNGQNLCQWEGHPADFDNDGDMDILQVLVHGGYQLGEGRTTIAINKGPEEDYKLEWDLARIRRKAPATSHIGDMSGSWLDFDNDGLLDLVISQSQYPQANQPGVERAYFLRQNAEHFFDEITSELGLMDTLREPSTTEPFDYDLDGDDDLLIIRNSGKNSNNRLVLMENNIGSKSNWVGIRLIAPPGVNRNSIGARITVRSGDVTQIRELHAGHGHFGGQQPLTLNVGIGERTSIDAIEVRWPGKNVPNTVISAPPINRIISIDGAGISSVTTDETAPTLDLHPNPAADRLRLTLPEPFGPGSTVTISDALGRVIRRVDLPAGELSISLPVEDLTAGYYFAAIEIGRNRISRPFVIER